jgi:tight adherence protein B
MDVFIIAIIVTGLTCLVFVVIDKRKSSHSKDSVVFERKISSTFTVEQDSPSQQLVHDYSDYIMTKKQKVMYTLLASCFLYVIGFIFYKNIVIALLIGIAGYYYPKIRKYQLIEKRKQDLSIQFKQALFSLSTALAAGKSVENAFKDVTQDLKLLYPDPATYIRREFELITIKTENGETLERALSDFNQRAKIEDITNFADVFITCKRSGGDLVDVIRKTSAIIGDKLEIQQEIAVMIAQKKFEAKILSLAPLFIVALLSFSSPDYMAPLYDFSQGGPIIMTISLLLLAFSYWITKRMMDIKV